MPEQPVDRWTRREFLSAAALTGSSTLLGLQSDAFGAEAPPETTRLRLHKTSSLCNASLYVGLDPRKDINFYALRLREAEMVKGSPQKIIAQGTDWRIWNELKKELKS